MSIGGLRNRNKDPSTNVTCANATFFYTVPNGASLMDGTADQYRTVIEISDSQFIFTDHDANIFVGFVIQSVLHLPIRPTLLGLTHK